MRERERDTETETEGEREIGEGVFISGPYTLPIANSVRFDVLGRLATEFS